MKNKKQKTILRYAGGKSRAIKQISPFVQNYDEIVSPFLGGGSLEVHGASMGKKVIAADVFDILINFWETLLNDPKNLANELSKINPTKAEYKNIKEELMKTPEVQDMLSDWRTDFYKRDKAVSLSKIKLAAYYYFNHNTSYGPGFLGWASDLYMNQSKWNKTIEKVKNFSCPNLSVFNQSFEETIDRHPNSFLYLDPPYYTKKEKDNKMLCGIYPMKNIPVHHDSFDHELLRDKLLAHDGDFVLSYNNCETIRDYYSDFEFYFPKWHYSMDIGETRIGQNRKQRTTEEQLDEVDTLSKAIQELEKDNERNIKQINALEEVTQETSSLVEKGVAIKQKLSSLKTKRHEIMKKESHEILIIKRSNLK